MGKKYDFGGWATRNDLLCSDGRTIRKDAFKHCDGKIVPLVWNHRGSDSPENILGQVLLHNCNDGVYCYGTFNDTKNGQMAKALVVHGDINSLSIYANKLKQNKMDVLHGDIKEVSLVLSGANPGAYIDTVIAHSDDSDEEAVIFNNCESLDLDVEHSDNEEEISENSESLNEDENKEEKVEENSVEHADSEKTVGDVFDSLTEEQKNVVYAIIGEILEEKESEEDNMKHNCFDDDAENNVGLTQETIDKIFKDAKRLGSLKEAVLAHADDDDAVTDAITYGIENMDYLFPDDRAIEATPRFIKRDTTWVGKVMSGVHHTPFARIKSLFADITEDAARAKGYIKGNYKKEEFFSLLKRSTTPTTIYKKQKLDRDDVIDITDFDVVAWIRGEMRIMLDEEIARAILVSDGRLASDDDKIDENHIRPIWKDDDLFVIRKVVTLSQNDDEDSKARKFIKNCIKARKEYKGSGNPTLFTTEDMITDCLLLEDGVGRTLYDSIEKLATKLRVKEIVPVPVMEGLSRTVDNNTLNLEGIIVNLTDYNVGANKGGQVTMFDDFDIDFNAQKYLIETRCSGALTVPYSAIVIESTTVNSGDPVAIEPDPNSL